VDKPDIATAINFPTNRARREKGDKLLRTLLSISP
jgi:hypothetical protein